VDGSLTSLSEHRGFRKFVVKKALEIGITGTIQRYYSRNVKIVLDISSRVQWDAFKMFLSQISDQKMIGGFQFVKEEVATFQHEDFFIIQDFSSKAEQGLHSDGSDYAKRSESSSNKEVPTF
jgi:acylphosphatase